MCANAGTNGWKLGYMPVNIGHYVLGTGVIYNRITMMPMTNTMQSTINISLRVESIYLCTISNTAMFYYRTNYCPHIVI